ncbi:hypothetical protein [Actinacidiphila glaucinigra]|uniref:hypothetical protein n=1 Tax=Actinacidiphila glaucinigra TaxID=235986 RepID=UPI0015C669BC|nr:hypothetical protein [Actinacidiphila glaucinigra]
MRSTTVGGFFVGLLLGVAGSCLAFGWHPDGAAPRRDRSPHDAPEADRAGLSATS